MTLQGLVQIQGDGAELPVVPAVAGGVHQGGKIRVCTDAVIKILQYLIQNLGLQQGAVSLVQTAEIRGDAQKMRVLPDDPGAEGVHCGDLRPVDQTALAA